VKTTDDLKQEHRLIEPVLSALERSIQSLGRGSSLDRDFGEKLLDFLRVFVDKCHHGKEERHLFKRLEERGIPRQSGLVLELLREHGVGRAHVRALAGSWPGAADGERSASDTFAEHARAYVELLHVHIDKEDTRLFPMADRTLSSVDDAELMEQFRRLEREEIGEAVHETYHQWVQALAQNGQAPSA